MNRLKQLTLLLMMTTMTVVITGCGDDDEPNTAVSGGGGDGGGDGGSGDDGTTSFDANSVLTNESDNIITQSYQNLNSATAEMLTAVQTLNDGGATEPEIDDAQAKWKAARIPWESSEGFLFGPVDSLGIDPAVDTWPLNTSDLQNFLSSNPNATKADVENAPDELRGFHAIEFLLFGDGVADNDKAAADLTAAELNYLVALVEAFKDKTQALEDSWTVDFNGLGPYATVLKTPGGGNTIYTSQGAAIEELVNGFITIVDEVGNAKIAEPFATSAATADTSLVESQYSWNSLKDFHSNIQSVLNAYTGKLGYDPAVDSISDTLNGVFAFVNASDPTLALRVLDEIIDAQEKIALINGDGDPSTTAGDGANQSPFRTQITDAAGRVLIQEAIDSLNTLLDTLEQEVLPLIQDTEFAG